ncbi:hypothetical protein [Ilumatobacter fluminis]|nr:hypothetical protein [Ilumatobacter fluminis]
MRIGSSSDHPNRARWAAIGAAVAIALGAGSVGIAQATIGSGERAVFVPVEACRLVDTRPAQGVPGRNSRLGDNESFTLDVGGAVGNCGAFSNATGLSLNVTPVGPSDPTYLSFVPGVLDPPTNGSRYDDSSNLNPSPDQPPTPNAVEVDIDDDQRFSVYNAYGSLDVVIDVVGYYEDHHHDDRYFTKAEVADLIAEAGDEGEPAPDLPEAMQSTASNVAHTSESPVTITSLSLDLAQHCTTGSDRYLVRVDVSGYVHYVSSGTDAIDAEFELVIGGETIDEAHLDVQLQTDTAADESGLVPEIPFSRSYLASVESGTIDFEWTGEVEYDSAGSFSSRDVTMIVQPLSHDCGGS